MEREGGRERVGATKRNCGAARQNPCESAEHSTCAIAPRSALSDLHGFELLWNASLDALLSFSRRFSVSTRLLVNFHRTLNVFSSRQPKPKTPGRQHDLHRVSKRSQRNLCAKNNPSVIWRAYFFIIFYTHSFYTKKLQKL